MRTTISVRFIFIFFGIALATNASANSGITYHGRILRPDGLTPVTSSVTQFRIQVRSPGVESCLLWEEQQTKDLSSTAGVFTLTIADSAEPTLIANTLPFALEKVFSNRVPFTGLTGCSVGNSYTPSSSADGRSLQVYFREAPTDPWEQMPTTKINFVPLALNSVQLEGYQAAEFLKIDPLSSYTPLTAANVNTLVDIIAGTSNMYVKTGQAFSGDVSGTYNATSVDKVKGVAVAATAPTNGQVLKFNGTTWAPAADDTGSAPADASYTVKGVVQINTDLATSGLFIAGGVLALPNVVTAAAGVGNAQTVPVITYDQKGRLTAVSTATIDDTTKLPLAGGTMTGNINMGAHDITNAVNVAATNVSVRNVVLNDNDTNTITVKAPADVTPANYSLTLPATAGTNGYVLSTDGSGNLSWINPSGGSVTSVSSANNYLTVTSPTTTPVLTVNVGTVANTVAAGDDARIVGALQTATYDADVLPAASCTTVQTPYWNGVAGTWACQNIGTVPTATSAVNFTGSLAGDVSGTQGATSVDKIKGKAVAAATAANQLMIYDGTSWVNNILSGDATLLSTGVLTLKNTGTAGTYYKVTTDAQGRVTSGSNLVTADITTALGYTPVNKAGDTMNGTLGLFQTAADPSTAGWNATQKGYSWFNTTSNQVKYWDGTAIQALGVSGAGLTSLGGQSGSTQTFAAGAAGTAPAIASAANVHTLNVPLASGAGVTSGTISKTDYDNFTAKLTSPLTTKGDLHTYSTVDARLPAGTDGQVLQADSAQATGLKWNTLSINSLLPSQATNAGKYLTTDGTNTSWSAVTSGTVTSVSSTNAYATVATPTTTPAITINVGTAANTLAAGDDARIVGALQTSVYDADVLPAASCTNLQTPYWNGVAGTWACQNISASGLGAFVDGGNTMTATATVGTNSNHNLEIETNGTTKMTVTNAGNVGIGTTSPTSQFDNRKINTATSGTTSLENLSLTVDPTATSTATNNGLVVDVSNPASSAINYGTLRGMKATATVNGLSTSTATQVEGLNVIGSVFGGTVGNLTGASISSMASGSPQTNITTLTGAYISSELDGPASATNMYGIRAKLDSSGIVTNTNRYGLSIVDYNSSNTTSTNTYTIYAQDDSYGTIGTHYGLYLKSRANASTSYGIYQETTGDKNYFGGNVGIGTTSPATKLDVAGGVRIGTEATACAAGLSGTLRYNGGAVEYCNGSSWQAFGVSGAGLTSLNAQTGSTQTFANGASGTAPAFSSATNVHTLNIPLASGAGVTSGTISKTDYDSFVAKLTSPLTTKGDILTFTTTNARLPVGTNGQVLTADSAQASGIKWATPTTGTVTSVTSANSYLSVATTTTTPVITANVGTTANTLAAGDDARITGAFINGGNTMTGTATLGTNSNHNLEIETNGTTRMTVTNAGDVGVGTTAPQVKLDVVDGAIGARSATVKPQMSIWAQNADTLNGELNFHASRTSGAAKPSANDVLGVINFGNITNQSAKIYAVSSENHGAAAAGGFLAFHTTPNTTITSLERMRIEQNGNVGIGTTSPGTKLTVGASGGTPFDGAAAVPFFVSQPGDTAGAFRNTTAAIETGIGTFDDYGYVGTLTNTKFHVDTNDTHRMTVLADGKVGIGTETPATKLEVAGGVRIGTEATACAAGLSGTLRYNGTSVEYCNGTSWQAFGVSGAGLTSLGGQTGSTQTFANGASGTAPAFSSATNVHTLNIPLASGAGVTSGTISKTDYDAFTAKLTSPLTTKGDLLTFTTVNARLPVGTNGQVLTADSAQASGIKWATPTTGTVTSVTSANSYLSVATTTTTPVITANVGTAANTLAAGDDARITGALQTSVYDADVLPAASCTTSQTPYWNSIAGTWACQAINFGASGGFVDGGNTMTATATLGTNSNHNLEIETNGTTKMTIAADGKVGIGTTAPNWPLHVVTSSTGTPTTIAMDNTDTTNANGLNFSFRGTTTGAGGAALKEFAAIQSSFSEHDNATAASSMKFWTRSSGTLAERMRIDTTGNIGIGTSTPQALLDVGKTSSGSVANVAFIRNTAAPALNNGVRLAFGNDSGSTPASPNGYIQTVTTNGGSGATDMAFGIWNGSAQTEGMRINSAGNIGIGNTNPDSALSISRTGATQNVIYQRSETGGSNLTQESIGGNAGVTSQIAGAAWTKVPDYQVLSQYSGTGFDGTSFRSAATIMYQVDGAAAAGSMPGLISFLTTPTGSVTSLERMRISAAGNVGIGTNVPNTTLDVNGAISQRGMAAPALSPAGQGRIYFDSTANKFKVSQNGGAYADLVSAGGGGTSFVQDGNSFAGAATLGTNDNNLLNLETNGATRMTIQADGKVGIGTTTTTKTLDVRGDMAVGLATGQATMSSWSGGNTGFWMDMPTSGPSGIGSGGAGVNAWIAYVATASNWFNGSGVGDLAYRNSIGKKIHIGIDNGGGNAIPTMTVGATTVGMGGAANSGWGSNIYGIQIGTGGSISNWIGNNSNVTMGANMYDDGAGNRRYIAGAESTLYTQNAGGHAFYVAPSGTANNIISYTQALSIASNANITTSNNLEVGGQVLSTVVNNAASTTFNFDNGNMQYTSASCGAMTLQNMRDGGTYTLAVQGTTQGTCIFTHGADTFLFSPANGPTVSGTDTTYHFTKMGSKIYVTWVAGYQ